MTGPVPRAFLLVLFGVLAVAFVVYVWNLDPEPPGRVVQFPSTTAPSTTAAP